MGFEETVTISLKRLRDLELMESALNEKKATTLAWNYGTTQLYLNKLNKSKTVRLLLDNIIHLTKENKHLRDENDKLKRKFKFF